MIDIKPRVAVLPVLELIPLALGRGFNDAQVQELTDGLPLNRPGGEARYRERADDNGWASSKRPSHTIYTNEPVDERRTKVGASAGSRIFPSCYAAMKTVMRSIAF